MTDFLYWKNALMGMSGPIHENDPQCGWYRTRPRKGFSSDPVMIWKDTHSGQVTALRGGKRVDPSEVWVWCCLHPVSQEAYAAVLERGEPWPDEVTARAKSRRAATGNAGLGSQRGSSQHQRPSMPLGQLNSLMPHGRMPEGLATVAPLSRCKNSSGQTSDRPASREAEPGFGHNRAMARDKSCSRAQSGEGAGRLVRDLHVRASPRSQPSSSSLVGMLDPFAEAREMADHIALLRDDVSSWLETHGPITDQVKADRCAHYASALSHLETLSDEMRSREKRPFLEACRSVDAKWRPVTEAAKNGKVMCKKAIETFLVSEWLRRSDFAKRHGVAFDPPRAGTFGRSISLRTVEKVVTTNIEILSKHYAHDQRLLKDDVYRKLLTHLADCDLRAGKAVPGAQICEQRMVS